MNKLKELARKYLIALQLRDKDDNRLLGVLYGLSFGINPDILSKMEAFFEKSDNDYYYRVGDTRNVVYCMYNLLKLKLCMYVCTAS